MYNHRDPAKKTPCAKTRHTTDRSLRSVHPSLHRLFYFPTSKILCFTMLFNRPDTPNQPLPMEASTCNMFPGPTRLSIPNCPHLDWFSRFRTAHGCHMH